MGIGNGGPSLRLFFALPLADELRGRAGELQRELARSADRARVKWVEAENLHMTLKFVGDAPAERLAEFLTVAEGVAENARACTIEYQGVGCFAGRSRCPRTIWLGLAREAPELAALAGSLDVALADAGLAESEKRPFTAHLTLGRVKNRRDSEALLEAARRLENAPVGVQTVDSFALISSELTAAGPIYTNRGDWALGTADGNGE